MEKRTIEGLVVIMSPKLASYPKLVCTLTNFESENSIMSFIF